jgi:hypothetical protein
MGESLVNFKGEGGGGAEEVTGDDIAGLNRGGKAGLNQRGRVKQSLD